MKKNKELIILSYVCGLITVLTFMTFIAFIESLFYADYVVASFLFLVGTFFSLGIYKNLKYIQWEMKK